MAEISLFVHFPPSARPFFGKRNEETRIYRREGMKDEIAEWYDKIVEVAGPVVTRASYVRPIVNPGYRRTHVPVSRIDTGSRRAQRR
jgi:hypothetical protein